MAQVIRVVYGESVDPYEISKHCPRLENLITFHKGLWPVDKK